MSFHDELYPLDLGYGSVGDPAWFTNIITLDSKLEERVSRVSRPRREYDVAYGIRRYAKVTGSSIDAGLLRVRNFHMARGGAAHSFRFRDPFDYSTLAIAQPEGFDKGYNLHTNADVLIGTGDGTTVDFQLRKSYVSGPTTLYVPCNKIVSGTTKVAVDGVGQTAGTDFTVNLLTGVLTFDTAPPLGDAITAGFEFDIETRFGLDRLPMQADAIDTGSIRSIPLVEVIDGRTIAEEFPGCGGGRKAFAANITIAQAEGRVWEVTPATTGLSVIVESAALMEPGGVPHYVFINASAHSVTLKGGSTTIGTLASGEDTALRIFLIGGVKTWVATTP